MNTAGQILHTGEITTNGTPPEAEAVAFSGGRVAASDVLKPRGPAKTVVNLSGQRAIPGRNDSH